MRAEHGDRATESDHEQANGTDPAPTAIRLDSHGSSPPGGRLSPSNRSRCMARKGPLNGFPDGFRNRSCCKVRTSRWSESWLNVVLPNCWGRLYLSIGSGKGIFFNLSPTSHQVIGRWPVQVSSMLCMKGSRALSTDLVRSRNAGTTRSKWRCRRAFASPPS